MTRREGVEVIMALNHSKLKFSSAGLAVTRMYLNLCPPRTDSFMRF